MAPRILARRECSIWLRFLFFALAEHRNNVGNKPRLINIDKESEVGGSVAFLTATLRGCPRPRPPGLFMSIRVADGDKDIGNGAREPVRTRNVPPESGQLVAGGAR